MRWSRTDGQNRLFVAHKKSDLRVCLSHSRMTSAHMNSQVHLHMCVVFFYPQKNAGKNAHLLP